MTWGKRIRLAGAVACIVGAVTHILLLNLIGLLVMFIGVVAQVDNLERRVEDLEPKEDTNEEN